MSFEEKFDFGKAYRKLMDETKEHIKLFEESVPKWKKDLLIFLLMKSKEKRCSIKTRFLKKKVTIELDEAWEE